MRTIALLSLTALALAAPAEAQDRRERVEIERDALRRGASTRVLQLSRTPRAVLGIGTAPGRGLEDTLGVLVSSVTAEGPAARAGIKEGDRIQAIGGVSLRISPADAEDPLVGILGSRRLTRELGKRNPGDEVELRVASGNGARNVRVRLADADTLYRRRVVERMRVPGAPGSAYRVDDRDRASLGIRVASSGSRRDTLGVFVMGADDAGPAARAGIIEGARIASINGADLRVPAADAEDPMVAGSRVQRLTRALGDVKPGDEVELRVWQNGQYRNVRVRTVPADSLRRNHSTFIIGDGMSWDGLRGMPSRIRIPGGADMGAFRFHLAPEFHRDLETILDGAVRGAIRAREGAVRELPSVSRTYH